MDRPKCPKCGKPLSSAVAYDERRPDVVGFNLIWCSNCDCPDFGVMLDPNTLEPMP